MRNFEVTIDYSHESFVGYAHRDGSKKFKVAARNEKSARTKVLKISRQEGGGYERNVYSVKEI